MLVVWRVYIVAASLAEQSVVLMDEKTTARTDILMAAKWVALWAEMLVAQMVV